MKRFFDSSVLIPAFYKFDTNHDASAAALRSASRADSFCALRTLGEVYAVLTGLPLRPRITGIDGIGILQQIREKLTTVSLTEQEYVSAIQSVATTICGGCRIRCSYRLVCHKNGVPQKVGAEILSTWNVRDFVRMGADVARIVKTPLDI